MENELEIIAEIVAAVVIFLLAIIIWALFHMFAKERSKSIKAGIYDNDLTAYLEDIVPGFNEYHLKQLANSRIILKNRKDYYLKHLNKESKKKHPFIMAASFLAYLIIFLIFGIAISANISDGFIFGQTKYIVVETSSMSRVYDEDYDEFIQHRRDQIQTNSLIGLDKTSSYADFKVLDIAGYLDNDGKLIIHRIIRMQEKNNEVYFTFRGDANPASMTTEMNIPYERIVGKYNGFQNYGLGIFAEYIKSSIGLIAIAATTVFLIGYNITTDQITKAEDDRLITLAMRKDNGNEASN